MSSPFFGIPARVLGVGFLAASLCASAPAPSTAAEGRKVDLARGGNELFKEIIPSVIQVFTGGSAGSGYMIDKGGYAITNRHVAGVQSTHEVTFYGGDQTQTRFKALNVGQDPALDFALLKVEAPDDMIVPIKLADTDRMKVGDTVATCGSPGGSAGATNVADTRDGWLDYFNFNLGVLTEIVPMDRCLIVFGDIIGHEQRADLYQLDYGTAVQYLFHVDAAINHGNSGGPCVNDRGEAIGTNTWGFGGENHGYTVPVNLLARSAREILQYGRVRRPWLGIALHDAYVTPSEQRASDRDLTVVAYVPIDPEPDRMVIQKINKYSPAADYLKEGDIIQSVDGVRYTNIFEVYTYILNKQVGDKITLHIERDGVGLPPITIPLAEKQNRFTSTHITLQAFGPGRVSASGSRATGGGVVSVTY